jgi:hypothetical protein
VMVTQLPGPGLQHEGQRLRRAHLGNTHPWNRYFNHPLMYYASTIQDVSSSLVTCRYRRDQETRSQRDFWEPPDEFERRRSGDCEDHALWAWRQLTELGYRARLVLGARHAWVQIYVNGRCYLMEATFKRGLGPKPNHYRPAWSVERTGEKKFAFFAHYTGEDGGSGAAEQ